MATFNFQVDRVYKVTKPLSVHPDVGLMSEPSTLEPGARAVYRGLVEIGGSDRHVFEVLPAEGGEGTGKKAYTRDRAKIEVSFAEEYGELVRP